MNQSRILQQRLWRWHFWAGLLSLPLALVLAISGGLYLFKPHYVQWYEQTLEQNLPEVSGRVLPTNELLTIAQQRYPDADFKRYTLARIGSGSSAEHFHPNSDRSVEFEFKTDTGIEVIWVDRFSGTIMHSMPKQRQLMHWIKNLHGELTLGNRGSYLVELMAQWMIVLVITGLTLYLSRQKMAAQGNWGVALKRALLPSLKGGTSLFWRRLHGALGIWLSVFLLVLLISGLPWTQVWGNGFKQLQKVMGWDGPGHEWFVSLNSTSPEHHHSHNHNHLDKQDGTDLWQLSSEDQNSVTLQSSRPSSIAQGMTLGDIEAKILPLKLHHPVVIMPPNNSNGVWTVRSMTPNRPHRVTLHFDRWSGEELMSIRFGDYHPVKRVVSYGIALHEGALFGLPNLLLGLFTALGLVAIVITGGLMWWKRRPVGTLGTPQLLPGKLPRSVWLVGTLLALLLPLFAASVLLILALDFLWVRLFRNRESLESI